MRSGGVLSDEGRDEGLVSAGGGDGRDGLARVGAGLRRAVPLGVVLRQERGDDTGLARAAGRDGADRLLGGRSDGGAELPGEMDGRKAALVAGRDDDGRRLVDRTGARVLAGPLAVAGHEVAGHEGLRARGRDRRDRGVRGVNALARRVAAGLVDTDQVRGDDAERCRAAAVRLAVMGGHRRERLLHRVAGGAAIELGHEGRDDRVLILRRGAERVQRVGGITVAAALLAIGDEGRHQGLAPARRHRVQRLVERVFPAPAAVAVVHADEERPHRVHDVAHRALGDAGHGGVSKRTVRADVPARLDLGGGLEDRRARERPVDDLGRGPPRLQQAGPHRLGLRVAVRRRRPLDRATVAASDEEQALPDCRCAVIAGPQLAPLDHVAHRLEGLHEALEGRAALERARLAVIEERAPILKLFDVLQGDDFGPLPLRQALDPAHPDPRQAADRLLARLAALRLAEVLAVGAHPEEPDGSAGAHGAGVHVPDVLLDVVRVRMVDPVHGERDRIVVQGEVGIPADRGPDALGRAAAAREGIDDQGAHQAAFLGR